MSEDFSIHQDSPRNHRLVQIEESDSPLPLQEQNSQRRQRKKNLVEQSLTCNMTSSEYRTTQSALNAIVQAYNYYYYFFVILLYTSKSHYLFFLRAINISGRTVSEQVAPLSMSDSLVVSTSVVSDAVGDVSNSNVRIKRDLFSSLMKCSFSVGYICLAYFQSLRFDVTLLLLMCNRASSNYTYISFQIVRRD